MARPEDRTARRLVTILHELLDVDELEEVLRRVLGAAQELTGARYAALGVLNDERDALARFLTVGLDEDERQVIGDLPLGRGVLGELIAHPQILRLADLARHPRSYGFPPGHPRMKTFLGGPIVIRGEIYGNIYLTEKAGGAEFDEADEELLLSSPSTPRSASTTPAGSTSWRAAATSSSERSPRWVRPARSRARWPARSTSTRSSSSWPSAVGRSSRRGHW